MVDKRDKEIDSPNGKDDNLEIPEIMIDGNTAMKLVQQMQKENAQVQQNQDLTRYLVMEGMQNEAKIPFFTELTDFNDVLRMNTIESYVNIAPLIIRKTSKKNFEKINDLLKNVYSAHVNGHKRNMVSLSRKREEAYVRILSQPTNDDYAVSSGLSKFFGVGGGSGKKK